MDPDEPRANLSLQTIEMVDVEAVAALRDMSELESESIDVRFAPGEEEVDINEPQGQPLFHDVHPLVQVELHNCNNIGNQPPNNGKKPEFMKKFTSCLKLVHMHVCTNSL